MDKELFGRTRRLVHLAIRQDRLIREHNICASVWFEHGGWAYSAFRMDYLTTGGTRGVIGFELDRLDALEEAIKEAEELRDNMG